MIEFCAREMPLWHPISISGYHIREAGSTAAQELAFTLADGFAYVEAAVERGLDVDDFAPRLSFFFNAHLDFFEEIAKYRAARRIWARELRDRYGARNERSLLMRFHTQTAGVSLTAQQPRGEHRADGARGAGRRARRHAVACTRTPSTRRSRCRPRTRSRLALRTQQVIAHETGVVEHDRPARRLVLRRGADEPARGARRTSTSTGSTSSAAMVAAIKENFFQREIAEAAYRYQQEVESRRARRRRRQPLPVLDDEEPIAILKIDPGARAASRSSGSRRSRRGATRRAVERRLARARRRPRRRDGVNLMPADRRRRPRLRHAGRDVRRLLRGLGHLARDAGLLGSRRPCGSRRSTCSARGHDLDLHAVVGELDAVAAAAAPRAVRDEQRCARRGLERLERLVEREVAARLAVELAVVERRLADEEVGVARELDELARSGRCRPSRRASRRRP